MKLRVLVNLVVAALVGLAFVYFPRQNIPEIKLPVTDRQTLTCSQPGLKTYGYPLESKVTHISNCGPFELDGFNMGKALVDFAIGAALGGGITWLIIVLSRRRL